MGVNLKSTGTGIIDIAGNESAGFTTGATYARVNAPTLHSITRLLPLSEGTNAASVTYQVVFSIDVTGVDAADFSLFSPAGITGTIGTVSGSGASYTVMVTGISGDGTLRLDLNSTGTGIKDANETGIDGGYTAGESYTIDQTIPTLTVVTVGSNNANPVYAKVGDKVTLNFTASEPLLAPSATIAAQAATLTSLGGNSYKVEYTITALDAEGVLPFHINFSDNAGNAGGAVTTTTNSSQVTCDRTAPVLTAVQIVSDNTNPAFAKVGDQISVGFTASEGIGTPIATIQGKAATITNVSGHQWTAVYTLQSSDAPEGAITFTLNVADCAGNGGGVVSATTNSSSVVFDKSVPALNTVTIASDNANTAYAKPGNKVTLSFTASESVGIPAVKIASHSITPVNTSGNNWTASHEVTMTDAEGIIPFTISIGDAAGNTGTETTTTTNSSQVICDMTAPALSSVTIASSNGNPVLAKAGDVVTLNFTASEGIGTPHVTITTQAATVTPLSGNSYSATYTLTGTDVEGIVPFSISFSDLVGNAGTPVSTTTNTSQVLFDRTAPVVTSINRHDPTEGATTAAILKYRVTFSEGVNGVSVSDFILTATAPSSGTVASLATVSGSTYDVTVNVTNGGGGTLRLDLNSSATGIVDVTGNGISGGFATGEAYTLGIPASITGCPTTAKSSMQMGGSAMLPSQERRF